MNFLRDLWEFVATLITGVFAVLFCITLSLFIFVAIASPFVIAIAVTIATTVYLTALALQHMGII